MKFSVLQEKFLKGINTVTRAIPAKAALPILSNVLLSAEKGQLKLAATNMETTIITYVGASVDKEGAITLPARILKEYISNMSQNTITGKLENDILFLSSDKTKSRINGVSAEDYPELPEFSKIKDFIELDPKNFNNTIALVSFSAGTDESRPVFTGILIKKSKDSLIFASSDGFRLSEKVVKTGNKDFPDFSVIIPSKTLVEVAKIFSTSEEPIKFSMNENENLALFSTEDTFVATRTLEGEYPDYKKIVPKDSLLNVHIPFDEFSEAVRLTKIFSKEDDSALIMKFNTEGNIKVTSLSESTGEHESIITADIDGDALEIAFGVKYLMDYLNNIKGTHIRFSSSGNLSPCVLKSDENENYLHIIMPRQM